MKNQYGDTVARDMQNILNSKEFKSLFKKASFDDGEKSAAELVESILDSYKKMGTPSKALDALRVSLMDLPTEKLQELCDLSGESAKDHSYDKSHDTPVDFEDEDEGEDIGGDYSKDIREEEGRLGSDYAMADDELSACASTAIAHLIAASEALDNMNFSKTATAALELAEFVVTAKKNDKDQKEKEKAAKLKEKEKAAKQKEKDRAAKEKAKEKEKAAKEKAKKDEMAARDKKKKADLKAKEEEAKAKKMLEKSKEKSK